ncbi:MAG: hypothetical protein GX220_02130 [Treponema sp.]|nr:hypothetical protein [Treponema sp.]
MNINHNIAQKILLSLVLLIVLIFIITLIWHFSITKKQKDVMPKSIIATIDFNNVTFSAIGTLRASTSDEPPVPLTIFVQFPYKKDDIAFYEELLQKTVKMREIIISYFSTNTKEYFLTFGEELIKHDLLSLLNEQLVLGQIERLYFSEYIFFD